MAKKNQMIGNQEVTFTKISLTDLKVGEEIYLDDCAAAAPYIVMDVGNPFILIKDKLHFCHLYEVVDPIYKINKI